MKNAILILSLFVLFSCTNKEGAREALKDAGYHPIEVDGYCWFSGSSDDGDFYQTRFKAWNPDSTRKVSGCVCQGFLFKGKTIRLD